MAVTFLEPGTDATQDLSFWTGIVGTVTSATDQFVTGARSLKAFTNNPSVTASANTPTGVLSDAGTRISFRFRATQFVNGSIVAGPLLIESAGNDVCQVRFNTSSVLTINDAQGTTLATGTKVLAVNTWYRLTLTYVITSTTVFTIKLFIDGVLECTASSGTLPSVGSSYAVFSLSGGAFGMSINQSAWFDDIYIDNSNAQTDPGDIRVTAKRPFANGTTNGFTTQIGAGGSGYGSGHAPQVNERPLSQTNGWSMIGAGSAVTEEYAIEGASVGDVDVSGAKIIDFLGWVFAKALASETASIIVAGVTSNIALTSTPTLFTKAAGSTTYPGGGTDIGIVTSTTVTTVSLYECGVLFAYILPAFYDDAYLPPVLSVDQLVTVYA